ncbi:MAG: S-formylglutathione hydrolase [Oceanococcaceae bacterium]
MNILSDSRHFDGRQLRIRHAAQSTQCDMTFSLYLPPQAARGRVPILTYLSGLTCTDENVATKSGAQRYCAEHGVALLMPDTSPRGEGVPDDPEGAWDFGLGAGFYVDATQSPWATHYQMQRYIRDELRALVEAEFPVDPTRAGIFGHSMGGHGALTLGLKNPDIWRSISAFAPICAPLHCPWGEKALGQYLGPDRGAWADYDACALITRNECPRTPLLVDQGEADTFLSAQLKPELLETACAATDHPLELHRRPGYDHSYWFISSFIGAHIDWHTAQLSR